MSSAVAESGDEDGYLFTTLAVSLVIASLEHKFKQKDSVSVLLKILLIPET